MMETLEEVLWATSGNNSRLLGSSLFCEDVDKKVKVLSGGESPPRSATLLHPYNVLILRAEPP